MKKLSQAPPITPIRYPTQFNQTRTEKSSIEQKISPLKFRLRIYGPEMHEDNHDKTEASDPADPKFSKEPKITSSPLTSKRAPPAGKTRDTPNQPHQNPKSTKS